MRLTCQLLRPALKSALQAMGAAARTSPKADAKATAAPGGDGNDHSNMGKDGDGEDEDSKAEKKDKDKDGDKDKETENTDTDKGDQDKNHERKNQNDTASVAAASSSTSSPSKPSSKSVGQQIADMLQKAFKAMGEAAMVVQQPQLLTPIQLVDEEIHSLLEAKTVKELDETIAKISLRSRPSCCQLPSPKSASNLGTHVQNLKRRKVRDAAKSRPSPSTSCPSWFPTSP